MHPFFETQKEYLRNDIPEFNPGDTVRVNVRVKEGNRTRVQAYEGVCIARSGGGLQENFTFARSPTAKASSAYSRSAPLLSKA